MAQWTLTDNSTGSPVVYTFDINPKSHELGGRRAAIQADRASAPNGSVILFQGQDEVPQGKFSGSIRTSGQFNDLKTWTDKGYVLTLADDQARSWDILITEFTLDRRKKINNFWLFDYTVSYLEV